MIPKLNFDESWIIFKSSIWKLWHPVDLAYFQLCQDYLCVGVRQFNEALAKYAKVKPEKFDLKQTSEAKKKSIINRLLVRNEKEPPKYEQLVPVKVRNLLEDNEGAFKAQLISDEITHKIYEKNNKKYQESNRHSNSRLARKRRRTSFPKR